MHKSQEFLVKRKTEKQKETEKEEIEQTEWKTVFGYAVVPDFINNSSIWVFLWMALFKLC